VSAFLSKMLDVGDLPVPTFGNRVLKAEWLKWPVKIYIRFFQNKKLFTFLPSCCTRFLDHCTGPASYMVYLFTSQLTFQLHTALWWRRLAHCQTRQCNGWRGNPRPDNCEKKF